MKRITINIHEFLKKFNEEYSFLYDHYDRVAGYDEALEAFDKFCDNHAYFVREFCEYRQDFITSDREAAAFMFALEDMGGLDLVWIQ